MSVCYKLLGGFDLECLGALRTKYYQHAVLVNKADVNQKVIYSSDTENRIYFNLFSGKTGFLFRSTENGGSISGEFSKSEDKGVVYYSHRVQIPLVGVTEDVKAKIKQLDMSNFFVALLYRDETVEIFGFNYGMRTDPYTYTPQGTGGAVLSLVSRFDEYDPPYVYLPSAITTDPGVTPKQQAVIDFDNLFANVPEIFCGDFNADFNDDFFIDCGGS
jgi:hypothetical protein